MERAARTRKGNSGGLYFASPSTSLQFVPSGCFLLDLVLGGGWPLGRMANIIGDKSTGKTLLAIEACANFDKTYSNGGIYYREAEAAFDQAYAEALGMPVSRVSFKKVRTVEELDKDLKAVLTQHKESGEPGLYILDSLDALTTGAELDRDMGEATYGTEKAKMMSEFFRKRIGDAEDTQVALIIISQIRAKIGIAFGDKTTRSGGAALDFYASQILKLAHLKTLTSTRSNVKRAVGIRVKAKCTKNKVGLPFRECEFVIRYGYGIEDFDAGMGWLMEVGRTKDMGLTKSQAEAVLDDSRDWDDAQLQESRAKLQSVLAKVWSDIETGFLPQRRKY